MKILLLSSLSASTGNCVTARRIASHFQSQGHRVTLCDALKLTPRAFHQLIAGEATYEGLTVSDTELIFGIHAYRSGQLLLDCDLPFVIIFGGTDVFVDPPLTDKFGIMSEVLTKASAVVAFSDEMARAAEAVWPTITRKLWRIPQSADSSDPGAATPPLHLRSELGLAPDSVIFLLPSGLRPVKDPSYLVAAFKAWHSRNPAIWLVIMGPELDAECAAALHAELAAGPPGVVYHAPIDRAALHHVMAREAAAVLNSSREEGMSNSLLEAMTLGVPVVARRNAGNMSLVRHRETGLLFDTPDEAIACCEELLRDSELRARLVAAAAQVSNADEERRRYIELLGSLTGERSGV